MATGNLISLWMWVLVLMAKSCSGQIQGNIYNYSADESLLLGNMTKLISAPGWIYHLEADNLRPGNILFSDYYALRTTDGVTFATLAGSSRHNARGHHNSVGTTARFNGITGFVQQSWSNRVLLCDAFNHCLRLFNTNTGRVTDLAGTCTSAGYLDGDAKSAKFTRSWSFLSDPRNTSLLIIADVGNNALRYLNLNTMAVSTMIYSTGLNYPTAAVWENNQYDSLLVAGAMRVNRLLLSNMSIAHITGQDHGFADGSLESARYSTIKGIIYLRNDLYIVSDNGNHRLRLIDLKNNRVSSICMGDPLNDDGPVTTCNIRYPFGLLLLFKTLYIGGENSIRQLPVSLSGKGGEVIHTMPIEAVRISTTRATPISSSSAHGTTSNILTETSSMETNMAAHSTPAGENVPQTDALAFSDDTTSSIAAPIPIIIGIVILNIITVYVIRRRRRSARAAAADAESEDANSAHASSTKDSGDIGGIYSVQSDPNLGDYEAPYYGGEDEDQYMAIDESEFYDVHNVNTISHSVTYVNTSGVVNTARDTECLSVNNIEQRSWSIDVEDEEFTQAYIHTTSSSGSDEAVKSKGVSIADIHQEAEATESSEGDCANGYIAVF